MSFFKHRGILIPFLLQKIVHMPRAAAVMKNYGFQATILLYSRWKTARQKSSLSKFIVLKKTDGKK